MKTNSALVVKFYLSKSYHLNIGPIRILRLKSPNEDRYHLRGTNLGFVGTRKLLSSIREYYLLFVWLSFKACNWNM